MPRRDCTEGAVRMSAVRMAIARRGRREGEVAHLPPYTPRRALELLDDLHSPDLGAPRNVPAETSRERVDALLSSRNRPTQWTV